MIGQIGRLDTRITIEAATDSVDAQGSVTKTWASIGTVWANAKAMTATESANGNERSASRDYQFKIRKQSSVAATSAGHRIKWNGIYYDVTGALPMPEGRPDHLLISATRKA